jgi:hypothetical protein
MTSQNDSLTASNLLQALRRDRPDLFTTPEILGYRRGVDFYPPHILPVVFGNAVKIFRHAHGRLPDLITLPATADHFFKMKFFDHIPVSPNPASKLACHDYVPARLAGKVLAPRHLWVSERPVLPPDGEVPRGICWLKLEFGNAGHLKLNWPPTPEQRRNIDQSLGKRMKQRFGTSNGEWWYGIGPQRVFLEEDLSDILTSGQEFKLFIRDGRFAAGYEVQYASNSQQKRNSLGFFDELGAALSGTRRLGRHNPDYEERKFQRPPDFEEIVAAAEAIGRPFSLVRIDMMRARDGRLFLGELTLCTGNTTMILTPHSLEHYMRSQLFEGVPQARASRSLKMGDSASEPEKPH